MKMKKIFLTLILSFTILSCETTTSSADPDGRSLIDPTEMIEVATAFNNALNSGDIEMAASMLDEDAGWSFPNGVNVEGKEAVVALLENVNQIWTTIDQSSGEDTAYLGVTGGDEGEEWKALLSWGEATYANDSKSVTVPYHQVTWFTDDNLIGWISGLYDRTELVASYDDDPIK